MKLASLKYKLSKFGEGDKNQIKAEEEAGQKKGPIKMQSLSMERRKT